MHTLQEHFHEIVKLEEIMLILHFFAKSVWMLKATRQPRMAECTGFCQCLEAMKSQGYLSGAKGGAKAVQICSVL